jgi:cellulose synthase/poly-beta-1,6-N-acetylglucosamine synthase-like glycosyltransferase
MEETQVLDPPRIRPSDLDLRLLAEPVATEPFRHSSRRVLSGSQQVAHLILGVVWLAVNVGFWRWWLSHSSGGTSWMYWIDTVALFYQATVMPTFLWWFLGRMRRPVEISAREGKIAELKVALITLCVPSSESIGVVKEQLEALGKVSHAHDSWILDEGGSDDVRALARVFGVKYFTRHGISKWNEPRPPFQASTKAGNVNAWLDHLTDEGIDYDVFVQFDIDHHPRADYLDRVLGYFRDDEVAWVQAPSVCANLEEWTARGLAEQDLIFQGPLQMGFYGATRTPFIIGSHTSYRMEAIREIGGFQPTRAEDHLDTVVLAARGYSGVYVPEVIAAGSGPHDFPTYLRQQFAWAHSMIQIFRHHTPRLIGRYSPVQAVQFLMCQSWYLLWSLSLALLWLLPSLALFFHRPIASTGIGEFLLHFLLLPITAFFIWYWARRWFQPRKVGLSWRSFILEMARWPVVAWALVNVVFHIKRPYMVTPKGVGGRHGPRAGSVYGPYIFLAALPIVAIWTFRITAGGGSSLQGYFALALINATLGALLVVTVVSLEIREMAGAGGISRAIRGRAGVLTSTLLLLVGLTGSAAVVWGPMMQALRA